jgi:hypothetical protein
LLIEGGRTAHSTFKIPIIINDESICNISKNSSLAQFIRQACLVIWDEAPMQHCHIHEAVNRTFQDIRSDNRLFGGLTVVFGGDFQQILPVIIKGGRADMVGACMQRSVLWGSIQVLHLTQNMRLQTANEEERQFAQWQLDVGHGRHTDAEGNITLPNHFQCQNNTLTSLIDTIYPHLPQNTGSAAYFSERTILSSKNDDVDDLNHFILDRLPGEEKVLHSVDTVVQSGSEDEGQLMYPVEYLNSINCSGLPLAHLRLKVGCPIMVLRNLDPGSGVCNGSRGILTKIGQRVLEIKLLTGDHAGTCVFIPRIGIIPSDHQVLFSLKRHQFPIRLCFAMTVNKSQGQSVKHVGLDLRSPVFTHGQFYVAISRVTSVRNIKAIWDPILHIPITKNIVYPEVIIDAM